MLPVRCPPEPGASLAGYLWRVAHLLHTNVVSLVSQLDPTPRVLRDSLQFSLRLSDALGAQAEVTFGLDRENLDAMTSGGSTLWNGGPPLVLQRDEWWNFRNDRFCPRCLNGTGLWLQRWLSPWSFGCTTHECVRADECPMCHSPARLLSDGFDGHRGRGSSLLDRQMPRRVWWRSHRSSVRDRSTTQQPPCETASVATRRSRTASATGSPRVPLSTR